MFKGFGIEKVFESYIDPPKLNLNPNLRNIRNLRKHPPLPPSLFANSIIEPLSPINTTLNFNFSYGKEQQPSNQNHPSSSYLSYLSIHTFPFPNQNPEYPINEKTFVKSIYRMYTRASSLEWFLCIPPLSTDARNFCVNEARTNNERDRGKGERDWKKKGEEQTVAVGGRKHGEGQKGMKASGEVGEGGVKRREIKGRTNVRVDVIQSRSPAPSWIRIKNIVFHSLPLDTFSPFLLLFFPSSPFVRARHSKPGTDVFPPRSVFRRRLKMG